MVIGIGTDLLDIRRIEKINQRFPKRFGRLILSEQEKASGKPDLYASLSLAKRFAAKEAIVKACGLGFCPKLWFKDITVLHGLGKAPEVYLSQTAAENLWKDLLRAFKIKIDLSLSDEYPYIQAFVIISKEVL